MNDRYYRKPALLSVLTKTTAAIIIIITITIIIIKLVVCSRRADYHSVNRQQ